VTHPAKPHLGFGIFSLCCFDEFRQVIALYDFLYVEFFTKMENG
jgi:hypothetical protein